MFYFGRVILRTTVFMKMRYYYLMPDIRLYGVAIITLISTIGCGEMPDALETEKKAQQLQKKAGDVIEEHEPTDALERSSPAAEKRRTHDCVGFKLSLLRLNKMRCN